MHVASSKFSQDSFPRLALETLEIPHIGSWRFFFRVQGLGTTVGVRYVRFRV